MGWEPIEISEQDVHAFAARALEFYDRLDDAEKALARAIIARAGGADDDGSAAQAGSALERLTQALLEIWEPGTTIAPLYSGDMPRTGGGTID